MFHRPQQKKQPGLRNCRPNDETSTAAAAKAVSPLETEPTFYRSDYPDIDGEEVILWARTTQLYIERLQTSQPCQQDTNSSSR